MKERTHDDVLYNSQNIRLLAVTSSVFIFHFISTYVVRLDPGSSSNASRV
jgi:hypothetical protein